ncbi:hypothetical protein M408DRAFT_333007 [Serendipita vermifera MAFF 305830]|uniref:Peptidase M16 N-terminal domain-containing protein n=1 Tax=Serendipita vermifera MAFF 305830 TaxID=933852 RepID=A0A0C2W713_SERVB|nr:hypothetical protein M408DRAFT_333007 [Serendipita vermifera MAFF 305830]
MNEGAWTRIEARSNLPPYHLFTKAIRKNDVDKREYRLIKLENGLQALLIHDSTADKAAAAMDVGVGHMADPDDIPGLAHFCEHLLFMGTRAFPSEGEYKQYITSHGGSANAYTSTSNTCYHFSVSAQHLVGAIERFSGFFHSPLFDPSCTLRELNAVDSEHRKNAQADVFRVWQLSKDLSIPGHPFGKFGTGNIDTLTQAARDKESNAGHDAQAALKGDEKDGGVVGRETRRRLIEWWETHYCASIMSLAILGRESLDDLTKLVLDQFSAVPNRGLAMPTYSIPWGPEQRGKLVLCKTVLDVNTLEMIFPITGQDQYYRSKPITYLSHFIGHEGPGSLHSYLKHQGWVTRLWSGAQSTARGFALMKLNIRLTKSGLENYRAVLAVIYSFLSLLRSAPLAPWNFEEFKALQEISFMFSDMQRPDTYVTRLSEHLSRPWAKEDILCAPTVVWDNDEGLVRRFLENDLLPNMGTVMITAKDFTPIGVVSNWQKEKWYGTEFQIQDLDSSLLAKATGPNQIKELLLPHPNEFIPQKFTVEKRDVSQPSKRPFLISKTAISTVWYKKDDQFWLPKGNIGVFVRSPIANSSAKNSVMTKLTRNLVTDALTEYSYDASLAGLDYAFTQDDEGNLLLQLGGYTDKILKLWHHLLEKTKAHVVKADRFLVYKEEIKKGLENGLKREPYILAHQWMDYALRDVVQTIEEQIEEIDYVTVKDLQDHMEELFSRARVNVLVDGNFNPNEALEAQRLVETMFKCRDILPSEAIDRTFLLPPGKSFVHHQTLHNTAETNNAVEYYVQLADYSDSTLAKLRLFSHLVNERAFNTLRTKEQLGYVVSSSFWIHASVAGMFWRVQSEKPTEYVESRIDAFLESLKEVLQTMSPADFERQRRGLVTKLAHKYDNTDEEYTEFALRILDRTYDFTAKAKSAALIENLTLSDIQEFYAAHIDPNSKQRAKLSIHVHAHAQAAATKAADKPIKFSVAASNAFLVDLKSAQVPVDEPQYLALSKAEPPLDAVLQFWTMHLGQVPFISNEKKEHLLARAKELALQHPVAAPAVGDAPSTGKLRDGTIVIGDLMEFKKGLQLFKPATPVMGLEVEEVPADSVGSRL